MMNDILIETRSLKKVYSLEAETINAVNNISIKIDKGEFVAVMGPSGSGKTTLLDILGCMDSASSGSFTFNDEELSRAEERRLVKIRREHIGFVFQDFLLIDSLTAIENVLLPLSFNSKEIDREKAKRLLERVGLCRRFNHLPRQLSGGEKQRVAIARALINDPLMLIADEPTGNLDSSNSEKIISLLKEENRKGMTIIMATHDLQLGQACGSVLRMHDGEIIAE